MRAAASELAAQQALEQLQMHLAGGGNVGGVSNQGGGAGGFSSMGVGGANGAGGGAGAGFVPRNGDGFDSRLSGNHGGGGGGNGSGGNALGNGSMMGSLKGQAREQIASMMAGSMQGAQQAQQGGQQMPLPAQQGSMGLNHPRRSNPHSSNESNESGLAPIHTMNMSMAANGGGRHMGGGGGGGGGGSGGQGGFMGGMPRGSDSGGSMDMGPMHLPGSGMGNARGMGSQGMVGGAGGMGWQEVNNHVPSSKPWNNSECVGVGVGGGWMWA